MHVVDSRSLKPLGASAATLPAIKVQNWLAHAIIKLLLNASCAISKMVLFLPENIIPQISMLFIHCAILL